MKNPDPQMNREGWLMDRQTKYTKRFYRDEKSWSRHPFVFVDLGKTIPNKPALLKCRDYLHITDAIREWKRLKSEGWTPVSPQWGIEEETSSSFLVNDYRNIGHYRSWYSIKL